ncbi:hypothetical protein [Streptomyces sp. NPDC053367]|uniref:hypothetical protein n=1 Tax=Streptomyces sp. NPDC053367 TaxID=3365700 RepID=UPI0037CFE145
MILVVASRRDAGARRLVRSWGPEARLLTPDDLSSPGWSVRTEDPRSSRAVVQGEVVTAGEITGVVTRLPAVTSQEVRRIHPDDRDYAASEMTAFLHYWLSALPCPVLNRPGPTGLCGPGWRSEQWSLTARRLGIPVRAVRREVPQYQGAASAQAGSHEAPGDRTRLQVTVIGGLCVGGDDHHLAEASRALAAAADVPLLTVFFEADGSQVRFVDAHPWTNAFDPRVTEALRDHLDRARSASERRSHRRDQTS